MPRLLMSTDCLPESDSMSVSGALRIRPDRCGAPRSAKRPGSDYVRRSCAGPEEIAVARYYFDIHDGAQSVRDDDGAEFDSPEAAVQA